MQSQRSNRRAAANRAEESVAWHAVAQWNAVPAKIHIYPQITQITHIIKKRICGICVICGVSRTRARARDAVLKMGDGLPKSTCRSGLQTARCCCVQKAWW